MDLFEIYKTLYSEFGQQRWWPAKTKFEVCVGAILTQNTTWLNVEKVIKNLKKERILSSKKLAEIEKEKIAELIKPAGYFTQKADYLKSFSEHVEKNYSGSLERFFDKSIYDLRNELLSLKGIGNETADSIILYAAKKPIFVIDAYTKRIMFRLGSIKDETIEYDELQEIFHSGLSKSAKLFNEFHALLVNLGKNYCLKTEPKCGFCPLKKDCDMPKSLV